MEEKIMTYLCRFDADGRRGVTRLACEYTEEQKAEMIADGFVEISQEDWELYCEDGGNKYIRGADGKPTLVPPHVPTKAELLAQLESQYKADKSELTAYFAEAMLSDNAEVMSELKSEMSDLEAEYEAKRTSILEG